MRHLSLRTAPLALVLACTPDGGGDTGATEAPGTSAGATDTPTTGAPTTGGPGTGTIDPDSTGDPPDPTTTADPTTTTSTTTAEPTTAADTTRADDTTGALDPCAGLELCEGFEAAAVGGPPDPAQWTVSSPNCSGSGSVQVSADQARTGARSLRVDGGGGYCDHVFIAHTDAVKSVGPQVYGRFHVRLGAALGDGHVTFLTLRDSADGGKDLRMGGQAKIAMWNRESDDATLPSLSPAGIALSVAPTAEQWTCVEFLVDQEAGALTTWIDGAEVTGLVIDAAPTPDVDQQWLSQKPGWRPVLEDIKLGWESYAGQTMTLYFDDIALAGARIGCD